MRGLARAVRVPFADAICLRLPGEPGDDFERDVVLLADAFPTGYHADALAPVTLPGRATVEELALLPTRGG